jgi:hypothetical protein
VRSVGIERSPAFAYEPTLERAVAAFGAEALDELA